MKSSPCVEDDDKLEICSEAVWFYGRSSFICIDLFAATRIKHSLLCCCEILRANRLDHFSSCQKQTTPTRDSLWVKRMKTTIHELFTFFFMSRDGLQFQSKKESLRRELCLEIRTIATSTTTRTWKMRITYKPKRLFELDSRSLINSNLSLNRGKRESPLDSFFICSFSRFICSMTRARSLFLLRLG